MRAREKILKVLTRIKEAGEINTDPTIVRFDFNHSAVGADFLSSDEERRILAKLQNEGWIKLYLPTEEEMATSNTLEDYMSGRDHVTLQTLSGFKTKYHRFKILTFSLENKWNYINPFWLLWSLLALIWGLLGKLVRLVFQHWLVSLVVTILGLLAIDYTLAWHNASVVWGFVKGVVDL